MPVSRFFGTSNKALWGLLQVSCAAIGTFRFAFRVESAERSCPTGSCLLVAGVHRTYGQQLPCGGQKVPHSNGHWIPVTQSAPANVTAFHQQAGYQCGESLTTYTKLGLYFCGHASTDDLERAYKQFSWQWEPDHCVLPRSGAAFDELIQNFVDKAQGSKFIFAGDSFMVEQFISLRCLLGKHVVFDDKTNFWKGFETVNNIDFQYLWNPYLVNRTTLEVTTAVHRPALPEATRRRPSEYLHNERLQSDFALSLVEDDAVKWASTASTTEDSSEPYADLANEQNTYLILNAGAHWHGNVNEYSIMVLNVLEHLQSNFKGKRVFYRASSHGHADCLNSSVPHHNEDTIKQKFYFNWRLLEHFNAIWKYEITRLDDERFVFLNTFPMSADRADSHVKGAKNDCFHLCLPGVIDYWNVLLISSIVHNT